MSSAAPAADGVGLTAPATESTRWFTPERLLRISLWVTGVMCVLPFLAPFKAAPVPSFHAEMIAAMLGLLAMSALPAFVGRLELPRIALLLLGFAGLIVIQMLLGWLPYRQVGLLAALYLLWATGLVMLGGLYRRELGLERVASTLSWFLLAGALISALIGWAQHIDSDALQRVMMPRGPIRVWANLGQANQLADYLALGLASVAYLYTTGRLRLRWVVPATLALVYVLSLTGSRTSWVYLAVLVALSAGFWVRDRSAANRRLLAFSAGAVVAFLLLPWLLGLMVDVTPATSEPSHTGYERPGEERPRIWHAALLMFLESPALGIGFRQFGVHHFVLNGQMPEPRLTGFIDHAHNLALHVLTEFGLIGLALLVVFAVLWIAGQARQQRTPAIWWIWAIALIVAIHSMLEYPLWYTFFLGVAALVLGLGEARTVKLQLGQQGRTGRVLVLGLLALGWLVSVQLFRDYLVLENFLAFRYRYIHATTEVNRQAKDLLLEVHRGSLLAPYVELGLARTISVDTDHLHDKLIINGRAMQLFPIDDVAYRQAMLLALSGDQASAQRQWDLAVVSFPWEREPALLVVRRRVEDGLNDLRPLLDYAQQPKRPRTD
jgi:O-antigen ligase